MNAGLAEVAGLVPGESAFRRALKISAQRKRSGQMERVEQRCGGAAVARLGASPTGSDPDGITAEAGKGSSICMSALEGCGKCYGKWVCG
jgi:hypothetical protein